MVGTLPKYAVDVTAWSGLQAQKGQSMPSLTKTALDPAGQPGHDKVGQMSEMPSVEVTVTVAHVAAIGKLMSVCWVVKGGKRAIT